LTFSEIPKTVPAMEHELRRELWLPLPLEEVFPFFADAGNLEAITPVQLRFRILTEQPITMAEGTLIDYRLKLNGIPLRWRTRISEWNPPHAFTDEQLKGPYKQWIHRHTFEARDGGTLMTDHVRYKLPLTPLGDIAYPLIRRQVEGIFDHRNAVIPQLLPARAPSAGEAPTPSSGKASG
jgi:ligand-binding SRPBCC domain-containing protein